MNIQEQIQEFHALAGDAAKLLEGMEAALLAGKVPEEGEIEQWEQALQDLQSLYIVITEYIADRVSKEELPKTGSSVLEYASALENSLAVKYQRQLEELQETCREFLRVTSPIELYAKALEPFQLEAGALLSCLEQGDFSELEQVLEHADAPLAFLEAMTCEDFDSEENDAKLEQVSLFYPRRVQTGLAGKKYLLGEGKGEGSLDSAGEGKEESREGTGEMEELPKEGGSGGEGLPEEASAFFTDFTKRLQEKGALLSEEEPLGILSKTIMPSEEKKIAATIFINEIRKMNEPAIQEMIEMLTDITCLMAEGAVARGLPLPRVQYALEELLKKGYLRKYVLTPGGTFYCASPRLIKALRYREASRFVGVRQGILDHMGVEIEDKAASAAARLAFMRIQGAVSQELKSQRSMKAWQQSHRMLRDAFYLRIWDKTHSMGDVLVLGAFWESAKECDSDGKILEKCLQDCGNISLCIVAGGDKERAHALAGVLLDQLPYDFSGTKIVLYSFLEEEFFSRETGEKVNLGDFFALEQEDAGEEQPLEEALEEGKDVPVEAEGKWETPFVPLYFEGDLPAALFSMLGEGKFYAAAAMARAYAGIDGENKKLHTLLAYALNDPMHHCTYLADNAFPLIERSGFFEDAMVVSTALRIFFTNQIQYDYNIQPFYNAIKTFDLLEHFPALSIVLYELMEFKVKWKKGMDAYAGYRIRSREQVEREIGRIQKEAEVFYENYVLNHKKENASFKRFLETKKRMFSINSDFGVYTRSVMEGDREMIPLLTEFLQEKFLKEEGELSPESVSEDKVWAYIVGFWEKVGETMAHKRHDDLKSNLRNNMVNATRKAVDLLLRWCRANCRFSGQEEEGGMADYKIKRNMILEKLEEARQEMNSACAAHGQGEKRAGLCVISHTLDEIYRCIEGSFEEGERKYCYLPFLLTEEVLLDENYYPDFDMHGSDLEALSPAFRIQEHLEKTAREKKSYQERLREILEGEGDDYGSGRLIADYLLDREPGEELAEQMAALEAGVHYARDTAQLHRNDFVGELELAQSYGQIDNSKEDKKEKILQIIGGWYEWAEDTGNFGFFRRVMEEYLRDIRREAKAREKDLLEQLEVFRGSQFSGLRAEAKERRARHISEMIHQQNYTVAEVLLSRASIQEEEHEEVIEEDFLREFLDNYEKYYKPVATHKANFSALVNVRITNKEGRGAKRLADSWLPGGSRLGMERLKTLLGCLGFKLAGVKETTVLERCESYLVVTVPALGKQHSCSHPIAALGSGAAREGFRVVCLNGGFAADGLIDLMKQIGNSKHTLILHDYALSLSERRRLARKSKNALGDKFFGVIDRTVMMFLVRNYEETKMNRMLVSLIMPFGYYQPYVWESVNVMPPEIFMGRKQELEKIKSPTGVNIVYGGRQLGKSALLKKAREEIDHNENGDRAVYIDLKGLDYEEAANKIGHALFDHHVLREDIDTRDWDLLARTIRRRLAEEKEHIPYLLLLLDEADVFIESCEGVNYKPLDALKDIQNIGPNRFKFIVAGLRNIVRFKREAALGNNSVLTHLESMTVKPFQTGEARELMEIPLHYLGLRFPKEKEYLITLILANTNYFPGLIQMYCAKLLESMRNKDYAGYDEVNTPIYEVSESHIKKILSNPDFMQQIREKYIITLKLDEDNYYYLIALIMAYLYHQNGYQKGYDPRDIHEAGRELGIKRIQELDIQKLSAFMEELLELNVLRRTDDTHYLFTRFTFFQMMGTAPEVEDRLADYMED